MTEEEARYDDWMSALYEEHSQEALKEFTTERLQSYYLSNPEVVAAPRQALIESRNLLIDHPAPALVFATIAIEVGVKMVLLKPIVYGLVHDISAAGLITDLAIGHGGDRYRDLLFHVLSKFGGIDLKSFRRTGCKQSLWNEIDVILKRRNAIVHRAERATDEEAENSVYVASAIIEDLFPNVVVNLGLHLHNGIRTCNNWECQYEMTIPSVSG